MNSRILILLSAVSAASGFERHLHLPAVPKRSTSIRAKGNVAEEVKVLENMPIETSIYCNSRNELNASTVLVNRKNLECPIKVKESPVKASSSLQLYG